MTEPARVVFVVGDSERGIRGVLPVALRSAEFHEASLFAWYADSSAHDLGVSVDTPGWLQELADTHGIEAEAVAVRDIPEAVEQFASQRAPVAAYVAADAMDVATPYFRNLVGAPPCELMVLLNAPEDFAPARVLMAMNTFGRLSEDSMRMSYAMADFGPGTHVTFLRVVPPGMDDATRAKQEAHLREQIESRAPSFSFEVRLMPARSYEVGVLEALEDDIYDLVIGDTPRSGLVSRLSERVLPTRLVQAKTPMLLHSSPTGRGARFLLRAWNLIYRTVPSTDERERVGIYTDVRRRSRSEADYYVMLSLSVIIATFGLLLDSAAVVIGAMIVAPLMQPIIGIGLGISMGNARLTGLGVRSVVKGVLVGLALSVLIGVLTPDVRITGQLDARGQPQMLDLMIALASGAAGAYATCRRGVADTVAGVAIAVALVPPLATAGVGLALANWPLAIGASLLLTTNFIAIATSSALMFLWMGFKPGAGRFGAQGPLVRGLLALGVMVLVIAVSLVAWDRAGDARFDRRVEEVVEVAVQGVAPDAEIVSVRTPNRDASILTLIVSVNTMDPGTVNLNALTIQSAVSRELDRPVNLLVSARTLQEE